MYKTRANYIRRWVESGKDYETKPKIGVPDDVKEWASRLKVGSLYKGKVIKVLDRGAVISIAGIRAFLHISEISTEWINHPSEILTVNQHVDVWVISNVIDKKERISIKLTMKDPASFKIRKRKRHKTKPKDKNEAYLWEYKEALKDMGVPFSENASYRELERLYKKEYKKRLK